MKKSYLILCVFLGPILVAGQCMAATVSTVIDDRVILVKDAGENIVDKDYYYLVTGELINLMPEFIVQPKVQYRMGPRWAIGGIGHYMSYDAGGVASFKNNGLGVVAYYQFSKDLQDSDFFVEGDLQFQKETIDIPLLSVSSSKSGFLMGAHGGYRWVIDHDWTVSAGGKLQYSSIPKSYDDGSGGTITRKYFADTQVLGQVWLGYSF